MFSKRLGSIVFVLLLALAASSGAYVLKSWRWVTPSATYNDSGMSSSWRSALSYAADRWTRTRDFTWKRSTSSPNRIYLKRMDGKNGTLATTTSYSYDGWLYKVAIYFDSGERWHTSSSTPSSSKLDARSVATHEFGHALGLGHPQSSLCDEDVSKSDRPTMCQAGSADDARYNDTHRRSLEDDDEDGVEEQYDNDVFAKAPPRVLPVGEPTVCVEFDSYPLDENDLVLEADAILHGSVVSVGPTLWNSEDGLFWEDETSPSAPLPYHTVEIVPSSVLYDDSNVIGSAMVSILVPRMSPLDADSCPVSVGPFSVGDEVIAYLSNRALAWKTGEKRLFIQPVSDPSASALVRGSDGLFRSYLGNEDGADINEIREHALDLKRVDE